jgi:hypothetical protein
MAFEGVIINKIDGSLGNRQPNTDGTTILFTSAVEIADDFEYGNAYEFVTLKQAEDLGLTAAYDASNDELVHYEIEEFFRLSPDATLIVVPTDWENIDGPGLWFTQKIKENPTVKWVGIIGRGVAFNHADFTTFINTMQGYVNNLVAEHIRIDGIFFEGVGPATPVAISAFPDNTALTAPNCAVVIGQDPYIKTIIADTKRASVGSVLGSRAVRMVNESLGSVDIRRKPSAKKGSENYTLTDTLTGKWLTAELSDHKKLVQLSLAEQTAITNKGYIFAGLYFGYGGIFLNDGRTCVTVTSDYSTTRANATFNKAARILRQKMMPKIKTTLRLDGTTGFLKTSTVKALESIGEDAIAKTMIADDEIGAFNLYINPAQAPDANTPLVCKAEILFDRILYTLEIDLALTYQLNLS